MENNKTYGLLDHYVQSRISKVDSYPAVVATGMECIQGNMPFKLKLAIVLSELITFASHLRKPIELYDGTKVPVNAISFIMSGSGTNKDKSMHMVRKALSSGYEQLEDRRKEFAKTKAESVALLEGATKEEWARFYKAPKPLQIGLGTVEGLTQHFSDLSENVVGGASINSSEIGSDLTTNGSMVDIIKTISVGYDLGNIAAKVVKSHENQTNEIKGLPINALLFGSETAVLFDAAVKSKFKLIFSTQLARRSMFTFTPETPAKLNITSVEDLHILREAERERVLRAQSSLDELTYDLVSSTSNTPLVVSPETTKMFDVYLEHNAIIADSMPNKYPVSKLSRMHKQWLALKLSGAYAILDGSSVISEEHYCYAINTVELLANDLVKFEEELVKEGYEQLVTMCKTNAEDGEYSLTLHELRKLGYITGSASKSKVDELCVLAGSYDKEGLYLSSEEGIVYKKLIKTDIVGVSFKIFDSLKLEGRELKDYMNRESTDGYTFFETNFEDLGNLLSENAIYSCFQFKDGVHTKENLFGGTKFAILDIDKSVITDDEAHVLLEEYNHFIARTSDVNNEFKFRVILELDAVVDVDAITWKAFIQEIASELGLIVDPIPQSQIVLSYKNRNILNQLEGKPLDSKILLDRAAINIKARPKPPNTLGVKEKKSRLDSPRNTFSIGFEAEQGGRSNMMYRMLAYAIDLDADEEYIRNLAHTINDYWSTPLEEDRLERTLIVPALRRL